MLSEHAFDSTRRNMTVMENFRFQLGSRMALNSHDDDECCRGLNREIKFLCEEIFFIHDCKDCGEFSRVGRENVRVDGWI